MGPNVSYLSPCKARSFCGEFQSESIYHGFTHEVESFTSFVVVPFRSVPLHESGPVRSASDTNLPWVRSKVSPVHKWVRSILALGFGY